MVIILVILGLNCTIDEAYILSYVSQSVSQSVSQDVISSYLEDVVGSDVQGRFVEISLVVPFRPLVALLGYFQHTCLGQHLSTMKQKACINNKRVEM